MSLDGASLEARGVNSSGTVPVAGANANGRVKQYQKAATTDTNSVDTIGPADSFSQIVIGGPTMHVIGTVPPGKAGIRQISGAIQRATNLVSNTGPLGNTLPSSNQPQVDGDPIVNSAQLDSAKLSLSPQHE
jgi:hypothetical protein